MMILLCLTACFFITFVNSYQHVMVQGHPRNLDFNYNLDHAGPYRRLIPVMRVLPSPQHYLEPRYGIMPFDNSDNRGLWGHNRRFALHHPHGYHQPPQIPLHHAASFAPQLHHPEISAHHPPEIPFHPAARFAVNHPQQYNFHFPEVIPFHQHTERFASPYPLEFPVQQSSEFLLEPPPAIGHHQSTSREYKSYVPIWGDGQILQSIASHDGRISYNDGEPMPEFNDKLFGKNGAMMKGGNNMAYILNAMAREKLTGIKEPIPGLRPQY